MIRNGETLFSLLNCTGQRDWKAIGDRLRRPYYQRRVDYDRKIRSRKQSRVIGKFSFVNRTIQLWIQLPADVLGTLSCKPIILGKVLKVKLSL
jgi:hypothetical protein